ncbi:MAG TPA: amidohydrolase family protein [Phycisphaerae bacterium]|nr:amidohydrolase family protein [Phycisphaerae bacterium]HRY66600.1 amidohydrolase family protein [Phycisphaerae bacterium]HSA27020.1 amidohydrolase family protein [Phycisphaerae bacterium]
MRIDVNAFFGHWPYWPLPATGGDDLLRLMDCCLIDRAAVTSLRGLFGDWPTANGEALALARAHPDRLVPVACLSPMNGGGGKMLRRLVEEGFKACRLYPLLLQGYSLRSPFADELAATAGECGIPVIVPTRPMMNFRFPVLPIGDVADLADRHPGTAFILSGPNYLSEFRTAVEVIASHVNISIETSCMQGFQAIARMAEAVGAERVLFGTGSLLQYPACGRAKLDHADITPGQRALIGAQNAERVLRL